MSELIRVVREMGISHEDFFRTLPAALGGAAFSVNGSNVTERERKGKKGDRSIFRSDRGGKGRKINLSPFSEEEKGGK